MPSSRSNSCSGSGATTVVTEYGGGMPVGGGTTRTGGPSSIALSPRSSPGGGCECRTLFVRIRTCLCRRIGGGNTASNASKSSSLSSTTGNNRGDAICKFDDGAVTGANRASGDDSTGVAKPICERCAPPRSCRFSQARLRPRTSATACRADSSVATLR